MTRSEQASDLATIIRWVEGKLDPSTSAVVAEAAAADPRAREVLGWLRGFHRAATALPLTDPPPAPLRRPPEEAAARAAVREQPREPVEVVGRMLFDSRLDMTRADLRSPDDDRIAHLAFACDPADVVIDLRRQGPGRVVVEGQVLPADGVARAFTVAADGPHVTAVHTRASAADGRFRLAGLSDRVARLRLRSGELAVLVQFDAAWS